MKLFLSLILTFIINCSIAAANIGIIPLFYGSNSNFTNNPTASTPIESGVLPLMFKINKMVTSKVQIRLAYFTPLLKNNLIKSGRFNVFDAESTVMKWNLADSRLIYRWEQESVSSDTEDAAAEKISAASESSTKTLITPVHSSSNKYILIGWVNVIKANEIRQKYPVDPNYTSVLYNLNIEINYKIIDYDTREVITQFVAAGHGGIGRIVPTNINHPVNAEDFSNDVVNRAINSLISSIEHGLLVKQDLGLLPQ
ncbi:MAG: hypothetical protein KBD37_07670 [Burkholderiales bacterium]|nr:hypothetical protein [Burkholderiales bacterium]